MTQEAIGHALIVGTTYKDPAADPSSLNDADRMKELLAARGFSIRALIGAEATRARILEGYQELIDLEVPSDHPVVVYFSGHGGRGYDLATEEVPARLGEFEPLGTFRFIAPSDYRDSADGDFRGISSWELSLLLDGLTRATHNVTAIFDCCYAAQMSRDQVNAGAPRAFELTRTSIRQHVAAVKAREDALGALAREDQLDPRGNARAVRVMACGEWQQAYSTVDEQQRPIGVFTHALIKILNLVGDAPVSWRSIGEAVRSLASNHPAGQLPVVAGPVTRRPFLLEERPERAIPITGQGERFRLEAGLLEGVSKDDIYGVVPFGTTWLDPMKVIAHAHILDEPMVRYSTGQLCWVNGHSAVPEGAIAWPLERAYRRYPVRIRAPEEHRSRLTHEVQRSPRLRVVEEHEGAIAELRTSHRALELFTDDGELFALAGGWTTESVVAQLETLAEAHRLHGLQGERFTAEELQALEVEWGTVHQGVPIRRPADGAAVSIGDRVYIKVSNRLDRVCYVHAFSIGLRGTIARFSRADPTGVLLGLGKERMIGPLGAQLPSFKMKWPDGVPTDTPRIERLVVVVTTEPTNLGVLETLGREGAAARGDAQEPEPFAVIHCSWRLHALRAPIARSLFADDDNPSGMHGVSAPAAWLGIAAGEEPAPEKQIEIRICEVTAEPATRIDSLVCTRSVDGRRVYEARTLRIAAGTRGEGVLWRGSVRDLVEVYLWAAPDPGESQEFAALMADAEEGERAAWIEEAVEKLVIVDERAPWALAAGACAALANIAEEQLRRIAPGVAGLVHASYVAAEGYGVGRGRSYRGLGVALTLEITEIAGPTAA